MTGKTGMTGKTWMTRMTDKTRMTGKTRIRIFFFKGVSLLIFWIEKNAFLTRKCEVVKKFKKSKSFKD